jgi:hypothetical protein
MLCYGVYKLRRVTSPEVTIFRFGSNPSNQTENGMDPTPSKSSNQTDNGANPLSQPNKRRAGAVPKIRVGAVPTH